MPDRSTSLLVRNPVLKLRAAHRLLDFLVKHPEVAKLFRDLLLELRDEALITAEKSWRKHKGPMAAYWKAVGVYAGHISRAIRHANDRNH